ncbi:MAG: hypothetical protein FWD73_09430 [Polyangiaceae bacterium]|nr:hypothetical protein [Polyangiaceae bacterium]
MTMTLLEAFDLVVYAELLDHRIKGAAAALADRPELARETSWLASARQCLAQELDGMNPPQSDNDLDRFLHLPELAAVKQERGRVLQAAAIDAVEALHGSIREAAGERSPLLEALYANLKIVPLRRANRDDFNVFCTEFARRLDASYPKRMLTDDRYASAASALADLRRAFDNWHRVMSFAPMSEEDTRALEGELAAVATRLELACRQAVLLAEAALLAAPDLRDSSGIFDKRRRRPLSI